MLKKPKTREGSRSTKLVLREINSIPSGSPSVVSTALPAEDRRGIGNPFLSGVLLWTY